MQYRPHNYQKYATDFILNHTSAGLLLAMGLGKTVITLTAIGELLYDTFEISRVLIIAPKRVVESTWEQEAQKWGHLKHLQFSRVVGTVKQRRAALKAPADIYLVNRENVKWIVEECGNSWPFDMVVIDELSSFRNPASQRFRSLRRVLPRITRIVGLTGTPTPKGLINLWAQLYLLDRGERLGRTLGGYREQYFKPGRRNGYVVYDWILRPGAQQAIYDKISDICVSMKAEDWLELPKRINVVRSVQLPEEVMEEYHEMEKQQVLLGEQTVIANGAADLGNKLQQFANGAVYADDGSVRIVHDEKLKELEELVEEANGQPVLVFYAYKHDAARILTRLEGAKLLETDDDVKAWNRGDIPVLLTHPASAGHGLNLQQGGHIVIWFGMTRDLELYQQGNCRLDRQGQKENVIVYHIIAECTRDEDCLPVLEGREVTQRDLMEALKARVKRYERRDGYDENNEKPN